MSNYPAGVGGKTGYSVEVHCKNGHNWWQMREEELGGVFVVEGEECPDCGELPDPD